jgi:tetratricopeptide (TPR) repeat protein
VALAAGWWLGRAPARTPAGDPLAERGFAVTSGAAPGYVEDRACASCHADLWSSYQQVGMAQSFYRPSAERAIERFGETFFHAPTQRYYEMVRDGDAYLFRRFQRNAAGERIHEVEIPVDWVVGSGHTSRVYLYANPAGELYQLPLAWYQQTRSWGMAPGFDNGEHLGLDRAVRRECMFCHNAYPDVPAGSDLYGKPATFPAELPQGIGCQRCHGPGAEHARRALAGAGAEAVRAAIVNPARLAPERARDICYGCHMQPSVALPGVRRFGRPDYSFRPGEALADYQLQVDIDEEGRERAERFEINHHPYRLEQSRCFVASAGRLGCLTCHDPHRKVAPAARARHYRQACLTCHQLDDCQLETMAASAPELAAIDAGDCATCHMPRRRTEDVVQVVMTDHKIQRTLGGPELLAPRAERTPELVGVSLLPAHARAIGEEEADLYRASAVIRAGGSGNAVAFLARQLAAHPHPAAAPYLDLARGQISQRRYAEVEETLDRVFERAPGQALALEWKAIARLGRGDAAGALDLVEELLDNPEARVDSYFNYARLLAAQGRQVEALAALDQALELRPTFAEAHYQRARSLEATRQRAEAVAELERTLALKPEHAGAAELLAAIERAGY